MQKEKIHHPKEAKANPELVLVHGGHLMAQAMSGHYKIEVLASDGDEKEVSKGVVEGQITIKYRRTETNVSVEAAKASV